LTHFRLIFIVLATGLLLGGDGQPSQQTLAESKAIDFLAREVPAWSKNNGCFSCHNNGDAARALFAATRQGYSIQRDVLADTTAWVSNPNRWEQNKGDPGFSDKRLADIQFAASLEAAFEAGYVTDRRLLAEAARKVIFHQDADGAWHIDAGNRVGSPATYGTHLATYMALRTLEKTDSLETKRSLQKANRWLGQAPANSVLSAASLLLASAIGENDSLRPRREKLIKMIRAAQTRDGGWGPYTDSPPEPFDTAVVLLALREYRGEFEVNDLIRRGREFLVSQQNANGSWPATTRPPGGDSYAQRVSTTGWVLLALLYSR
jgi:hypothetical protein